MRMMSGAGLWQTRVRMCACWGCTVSTRVAPWELQQSLSELVVGHYSLVLLQARRRACSTINVRLTWTSMYSGGAVQGHPLHPFLAFELPCSPFIHLQPFLVTTGPGLTRLISALTLGVLSILNVQCTRAVYHQRDALRLDINVEPSIF